MWTSCTSFTVLIFLMFFVQSKDGYINTTDSYHSTLNSNVSENFTDTTKTISNRTDELDNAGQTENCTINFRSSKELDRAISKLRTIITVRKTELVFIHLEIQGPSLADEVLKNRLTEWQFLAPDEDLMRQMPIDYLVLIFGYSDFGSEDASIRLQLKMEKPGCDLNEDDIEHVKIMLWDSLLFNYSTHFLCHRNFERDKIPKFLLFSITSVWIGYDLDCQTMIHRQKNEYRYLKKDLQHVIIAVGCFLVAMQFLWLFHKILNKKDNNTQFRYRKGDRPSGIKRAIKKFLYKPIDRFQINSLRRKLLNSSIFRFSAVVNWTVLLFIGFFRVIYRHVLAMNLFNAHFIMYSNEPLCDLIESASFSCDLIFMVVSNYFVVFLAFFYYEYLHAYRKPAQNTNGIDFLKPLEKIFNLIIKLPCMILFLILPIATIIVVVVFLIISVFYLLKVLLVGLLLPHCFLRKLKLDRNWWKKLLIIIAFPITARPMVSSLLFILRSATYLFFVLFPQQQHLLRSFVVGMSIIAYAIKYEIEMVDLNAKILQQIIKYQVKREKESSIEEDLYSCVVHGLKRSRRNVKIFICKTFLVFIYFLITLQTIEKSTNNSGNLQEFLLSVGAIVFPLIADFFFKKSLTDDDIRIIKSLIEKFETEKSKNETYPKTVHETSLKTSNETFPKTMNETSSKTLNETSPNTANETSQKTVSEKTLKPVNDASKKTMTETSLKSMNETSPKTVNESSLETVYETSLNTMN